MKVVAHYDFNGGEARVFSQYPHEFLELMQVIHAIDAAQFKNKKSREKTMLGRPLFSPIEINNEFKELLKPMGWSNHKVSCDYTQGETRGVSNIDTPVLILGIDS